MHLTGEGYRQVGELGYRRFARNFGNSAIRGLTSNPVTGEVSAAAVSASKNQNAATILKVSNPNTGASAAASLNLEGANGTFGISTSGTGLFANSIFFTWGGSANMYFNAPYYTWASGLVSRWSINASGHFVPGADVTYDTGSASVRVRATYSEKIYIGGGTISITSGAGTPEGAVVAPVGSLFLRTDGGATTTLYVKTSGTGNTGWTAK